MTEPTDVCPRCGAKKSGYPCASCAYGPDDTRGAMSRRALDIIAALRAQVQALTQELAHWKICENCGTALDGPGICSHAISEHEKALEVTVEELLSRAERAEAELARLTKARDQEKSK